MHDVLKKEKQFGVQAQSPLKKIGVRMSESEISTKRS